MIGIDELAYTIWADFANGTVTRKEVIKTAIANSRRGLGLNDASWRAALDEEMNEAYRIAMVLFPELAK
jgi:hypothetical protein